MKNTTSVNDNTDFTQGYIKYRKLRHYKYQLLEDYTADTPIIGYRCSTKFSDLFENGRLVGAKGYSCDGASGPTFDTPTFMRGPFEHDMFYQFIRTGQLPLFERKLVDQFLKKRCIEDGMNIIRANYVYIAVRTFGGYAARPRPIPKTLIAPKKKR